MESTIPKIFCFVLMPFDNSFNDIYNLGIKEACKDAGSYCERVDEQIFQERILDRIFNQIAKADIIIADMTGKNPNVFYEVGYAHAIGKTSILLTKNGEDIPFDLKHFPHIIYNNQIIDLKRELTKRLKWYIQNPGVKIEDKLAIEVYVKGYNLSNDNIIIKGEGYSTLEKQVIPEFTFYNNSTLTFSEGEFKVGIIVSERFSQVWNGMNRNIKTTKLPDGRFICMLPDFETFFPSAYTSFSMSIIFNTPSPL